MIKKYNSIFFGICICVASVLVYFLFETDFHFISGALFGFGIGYASGLLKFNIKHTNKQDKKNKS